jgi:3-hydroxybutyryl-CoA dehydrogenase
MSMKVDDIRNVLIIGAGTMGQEIGLQCAMYGYNVTLYDIKPEMLKTAIARQKGYLDEIVRGGYMNDEQADATLARITTTADPAKAAAEADFVSESVPENPELKGKVFAQFNALCPPRTIFTTNTSSLIPSMFAEATGRPDRFAAFHFHLDVWVSNVVDVMPHPGTSKETVELLMAFAKRIGQIPILTEKESYSYILNAMLNQVNGTALGLVVDGVASFENVDRAWIGVMKMPIGPFGIMDKVGLDTVYDITQYWAKVLQDPALQKRSDFIKKEYLDKGHLGVKSGRGFYTYPDPAFARPDFLTGEG